MPKYSKKVGFYALTVVLLVLILLSWYKIRYSIEQVKPYHVNQPTLGKRVLIATQQSKYKDSMVTLLVNSLRSYPIYISVIDISDLDSVEEDEWTVMLLLHSWENQQPQQDAKDFLTRAQNLEKIIVLSTSADGDLMIEGIDGITSASVLSEVPRDMETVKARIEKLIDFAPL